MLKKEANSVAAAMNGKNSGYTLTGYECLNRGDWTVTGIRQSDGESVTFSTWGEWHAAANGATPQPGARLKYGEEPTEQHSVSMPVSYWRWAYATGNGSAAVAAAVQAAMAREGKG